jgi:hypothetical protein
VDIAVILLFCGALAVWIATRRAIMHLLNGREEVENEEAVRLLGLEQRKTVCEIVFYITAFYLLYRMI